MRNQFLLLIRQSIFLSCISYNYLKKEGSITIKCFLFLYSTIKYNNIKWKMGSTIFWLMSQSTNSSSMPWPLSDFSSSMIITILLHIIYYSRCIHKHISSPLLLRLSVSVVFSSCSSTWLYYYSLLCTRLALLSLVCLTVFFSRKKNYRSYWQSTTNDDHDMSKGSEYFYFRSVERRMRKLLVFNDNMDIIYGLYTYIYIYTYCICLVSSKFKWHEHRLCLLHPNWMSRVRDDGKYSAWYSEDT